MSPLAEENPPGSRMTPDTMSPALKGSDGEEPPQMLRLESEVDSERAFQMARIHEIMGSMSEEERQQVQALYPELMDGDQGKEEGGGEDVEDEGGMSSIDLGDPPQFFLLIGEDLLETSVRASEDILDFGLLGCQISPVTFVGLRHVPPFPAPLASSTLSSSPPAAAGGKAGQQLQRRRWMRDVMQAVLWVKGGRSGGWGKRGGGAEKEKKEAAKEKARVVVRVVTEHNFEEDDESWGVTLTGGSKGKGGRRKSGEDGKEVASTRAAEREAEAEEGAEDAGEKMMRGDGVSGQATAEAGLQEWSSREEEGQLRSAEQVDAGRESGEQDIGREKGGEAGGSEGGTFLYESLSDKQRRNGDPCCGMSTWEIVWKGLQKGGPLQRLKFRCNMAGYSLIQQRLDAWAAAAHSDASRVLVAASEAALLACGGSIRENEQRSRQLQQEANGEGSERNGPSVRGPLSDVGLGSWKGPEAEGIVEREAEERKSAEEVNQVVGNGQEKASEQAVSSSGSSWQEVEENVIRWGSVVVEGKFLPTREGNSLLLKDSHFKALAAALPARIRCAKWCLLYSTARDGISLLTLYRKVAKKGPCLLLVRDLKKHVFGCFTSEEWKMCPRYYGNGECFVFQVQPQLQAYRWTRANSFFMLSNATMLAIGGGDHYSMFLNADLLSGYSGVCETFGSKTLSGDEDFDVVQVEVWGFK